MIRPPAVAGRFYPSNPTVLRETLDRLVVPGADTLAAIGLVVPHAAYIYSGHVAGAVYSRVQLPSRAIILCPNHTGDGEPLSIMRRGAWQTPLGQLAIDEEMCDALMSADAGLVEDAVAHRREHALEVQLPFLQYIKGTAVRFAPIVVGTSDWNLLKQLGCAIGKVVAEVDRSTLIIASSDMNHYESDAVTRVKDRRAIEPVLRLDARGLWETVGRENISMCGFGPATAMILAANLLGATRAELVKYATSADVSEDKDFAVGYAGIVVS